nr:hypothetical protein [Algoriphagus alkaliphilus]
MVLNPIASAASLSFNRLLPSRVVSDISRISFKEMSFPKCFEIIRKQVGPQSLESGWV